MKEPQDHLREDRRIGLWVGILVLAILAGAVLFSVAAACVWWLRPLASVRGLLLDRIFYTILRGGVCGDASLADRPAHSLPTARRPGRR